MIFKTQFSFRYLYARKNQNRQVAGAEILHQVIIAQKTVQLLALLDKQLIKAARVRVVR